MTEFLFQTGISNACFALALALLALVVGATARRPHLTYMLWLLVFIKLVTPPIFNIPVPEFASNNGPAAVRPIKSQDLRLAIANDLAFSNAAIEETHRSPGYLIALQNGWIQAKPWLSTVWILGSGLVIAWSLLRVVQFNRLLQANCRPAPTKMRLAAKRLAEKLGLGSMPAIRTTSARISPLVWWVGGKVQVVVPQSLLDEMDEDSWQWILAHELAHVRRRDYLVRWLEWFAVACFWWNPVVWWAQRNLRASEELCCDALVLSRLNPDCHSYADSILKTVESLVCPEFRPPAMASEINSGGYLERRVVMIMSGNVLKKGSRLLQLCVMALALVVFPLGLVYGQDSAKVEKQLQKLVEKDQLTQEQADAMMATLAKMANRSDRDPNGLSKRDAARSADVDLAKEAAARAAQLEKLVAEGKLDQASMKEKLLTMHKKISDRQESAGHDGLATAQEHFAQAAGHLEKLFAEGKIDRAAVEEKLSALHSKIADAHSDGSGKTSNDKGHVQADEVRAIVEKVRLAVKAGELTAEEARAKLAAVRSKMSEADHAKAVLDKSVADQNARKIEVLRRIELAVESGKMTKEEAEAKVKAVRDQAQKKRDREGKKQKDKDGR